MALVLAIAVVFFYGKTARPQAPTPAQHQGSESQKSAGCIASLTPLQPARRLELPGVPNFGKITDTLYRGGQPSKDGFDELKKLGVEIIVNLRNDNSETERSVVTAAGLAYVAIPWSCRHPANFLSARFLQVLRENREKKIFVHCHAGVDRTGLMVAVYRMAEQGWTPEQANNEMKDFGFNFLHRSWCHALEEYEQNFPRQLTADPSFQPFLTAQSVPSPCRP